MRTSEVLAHSYPALAQRAASLRLCICTDPSLSYRVCSQANALVTRPFPLIVAYSRMSNAHRKATQRTHDGSAATSTWSV